MHISPELIRTIDVAEKYSQKTGKDFPILKHRYGLHQVDSKMIGLFKVNYQRMKVGVLGCVACHSRKASGQFIIGIGNKNIDVGQIGKDAFLGQRVWQVVAPEVL